MHIWRAGSLWIWKKLPPPAARGRHQLPSDRDCNQIAPFEPLSFNYIHPIWSVSAIETFWAVTRAVLVWLNSPITAAPTAGWALDTSAAPVSVVRRMKQQLGGFLPPVLDGPSQEWSEAGCWDFSDVEKSATVLTWTGNTPEDQTGMSKMKLSQEELRSLPPRPPGLPAASPNRRFVKLGRKTSDGSQQWVWTTGQQTQPLHFVQTSSVRVDVFDRKIEETTISCFYLAENVLFWYLCF